MRELIVVTLMVFVSCLCVTAAAQDDANARLVKVRNLKCEFGPGSHASWDHGTLAVESGRFGPPGEASTILYEAIDLTVGKAQVSGAGGSGELFAFASGVGITLIEKTPVGGIVMTTVYAAYDSKHAFPAVMSKHIELVGPFPQQYYGSCTSVR